MSWLMARERFEMAVGKVQEARDRAELLDSAEEYARGYARRMAEGARITAAQLVEEYWGNGKGVVLDKVRGMVSGEVLEEQSRGRVELKAAVMADREKVRAALTKEGQWGNEMLEYLELIWGGAGDAVREGTVGESGGGEAEGAAVVGGDAAGV